MVHEFCEVRETVRSCFKVFRVRWSPSSYSPLRFEVLPRLRLEDYAEEKGTAHSLGEDDQEPEALGFNSEEFPRDFTGEDSHALRELEKDTAPQVIQGCSRWFCFG